MAELAGSVFAHPAKRSSSPPFRHAALTGAIAGYSFKTLLLKTNKLLVLTWAFAAVTVQRVL